MSEVDVTKKTQELLSRLARTDTHPFRSRLNPEYTKQHIALSLTPGNLLLAMHRAREAQELAVSYRDFKVGAALVGLSFSPSNFQLVTGVNMKPDEESSMNVHAEQVALQKAHDRSVDAVSMIVVVGETQSDKQSGKAMHTLHPCGLCRGVMHNDELVDNDATLLASTLPDFSKIELYSLEGLHNFHEQHDEALIQRFEMPPLEMFQPVPEPAPDAKPIVLRDTQQMIEEEFYWNATIGNYLLERRMALLNDL